MKTPIPSPMTLMKIEDETDEDHVHREHFVPRGNAIAFFLFVLLDHPSIDLSGDRKPANIDEDPREEFLRDGAFTLIVKTGIRQRLVQDSLGARHRNRRSSPTRSKLIRAKK